MEPANSDDHTIPRMTWWPHLGTREWVEIEFEKPKQVNTLAIYWFDDTGRGGGCRIPASWRLFYHRGMDWFPMETEDTFGVERDRYNEVRFTTIETDAFRIEVQLRKDFSGGILEVRID